MNRLKHWLFDKREVPGDYLGLHEAQTRFGTIMSYGVMLVFIIVFTYFSVRR